MIIFFRNPYIFLIKQEIRVIFKKAYFLKHLSEIIKKWKFCVCKQYSAKVIMTIIKIEKYWVYQKHLIVIFFRKPYIFLIKQKIRVILKKSYILKYISEVMKSLQICYDKQCSAKVVIIIIKIEKYRMYQKLLIIICFRNLYSFLFKQKIPVVLKKSYILKTISELKKVCKFVVYKSIMQKQ